MIKPRGSRQPESDDREYPPLGSLAETDGWLADLENPDSQERATAAFVLGSSRMRKRRVLRALRLALGDDDTVVADFAAASLADLGDIDSLPSIERFLLTGPPRDRRNSAWAVCELGRLADESGRAGALAALHTYQSHARGWARTHAIGLLARLERPNRRATGQRLDLAGPGQSLPLHRRVPRRADQPGSPARPPVRPGQRPLHRPRSGQPGRRRPLCQRLCLRQRQPRPLHGPERTMPVVCHWGGHWIHRLHRQRCRDQLRARRRTYSRRLERCGRRNIDCFGSIERWTFCDGTDDWPAGGDQCDHRLR